MQQQLSVPWHRYKKGTIDWSTVKQSCVAHRQTVVAIAERVVELGYQRGAQTPWAKTVGTCHKLLRVADGLWTFLKNRGSEPINNVAECALRPLMIQGNIRNWPPTAVWAGFHG